MAIPEIIAQAKQIDVADLVGRYISLERASGNEWQGPCPKCGGDDRLHCTDEWWFCRQCHPKRGDAIDFLRHATGCTFQEATEKLTNQQWPERKPHVNHPKAQRVDERAETWFEDAARLMRHHQVALPGSEGAEYLRGRGLQPSTWATFGLGFAPAIKNPETEMMMPAIAIPWYRGGKLTAIRYRFLKPPTKRKITSLPGSKFGGVLFGGQALPEWVTSPLPYVERGCEHWCALVLCEGEINAMSIWQVTHDTHLHVMSMGSESGRLSEGAIEFAKRYGQVIVWMDKTDLAKQLMGQIPGAFGFGSPNGKDANDLLQAGTLGGQLVALRWQAAKTDEQRSQLIYDLWDSANEGDGLEGGTAAAYRKLCEHVGRAFDLVESEPGVWVTNRRMDAAMQPE